MRIIFILCILLIALPVRAGTYEDNFDDGDLGNWVIDELSENIEIVDGEVVVTDFNRSVSSDLWFDGKQQVTDFTVSFDGKAVRFLDNSPYMWLAFRVIESDEAGLFVWPIISFELDKNDIWTSLLIGTLANYWFEGKVLTPITLKLDTWYHITVQMQGAIVTIWVDNVLMNEIDWSDQPRLPEAGPLALGGGGAELHFDNFTITGVGLKVTPKGRLATLWGSVKTTD